jgi:hypothetical protein
MPRGRENGVSVKFPVSAAAFLAVTCAAALAQSPPTPGPAPLRLSFVSHAAFFSLHAKQPKLVDPQVYVSAPGEAPATSFQIAHAAGIRNAFMSDDGTQAARDANGRELGVDLQRWFSATGLVAFLPAAGPGGETISVQFTNLVPSGRNRLFELHLGPPSTATPLDGNGNASSFSASADGGADLSITAPRPLRSGDAVVLVFHSDGHDHGLQTGALGIDAEDQMVVRVP